MWLRLDLPVPASGQRWNLALVCLGTELSAFGAAHNRNYFLGLNLDPGF